MGKRMKDVNTTVEKLAIEKESQLSYSIGNKTAAIPDSSAGRYSYNNGILNHKELSDEELVGSLVEAQDEEAFNELVNRYADKIFGLALRITRNPRDADEVLQEVFLTIEQLDTFREESKFSTWLYKVATNASYMLLKANKEYENEVSLENYPSYNESGALEGVQIKDWSDIPDEMLLSKEAMEIVEKAVNEPPAAYRVVFHLRDVEGFINQEVAKVLTLAVTAVKSRIRRVRIFLRDRLSGHFVMNGQNNL
jgi:RNA polymerase sigma-70 factor (ECF subfamily)